MEGMKYLIALLAVAGLVVSALALRIHYMDPSAAPPCAVTEKFDCGTVNHSRFSVFPPMMSEERPGTPHIPVAAVGIVGYALIAIFALLGRLRIVLEFARVGFLCAAFLTYLEAYVIEMWCIYCVWSQAIISAIVLATVIALFLRRRRYAESMQTALASQVD
jgi:vitamin-K-epoxide reductase (warfarin-sensitive)